MALPPSSSLASLHSWWSDSNTPGATISLHALAKPLMRVQYHRQARKFIQRNQNTELTKSSMETLASYLAYKYVAPATKTFILEELAKRADNGDANIIIEVLGSNPSLLEDLLQSPVSAMKDWARKTLKNAISHESAVPINLVSGPQPMYILLINGLRGGRSDSDSETKIDLTGCGDNINLTECGVQILSKASATLAGADAVVLSGGLDHVPSLLRSPSVNMRRWTCKMLGHIAASSARNTAEMADEGIPALLVSATGYACETTRAHAVFALSRMCRWEDGAEAVISAGGLSFAQDFLHQLDAPIVWQQGPLADVLPQESLTLCDQAVLQSLCTMVGNLMRHDKFYAIVCRDIPPTRFALLLRAARIARYSAFALAQFSLRFQSAQVIVGADFLNHIKILFNYCTRGHPSLSDPKENQETRLWTCELLGNLASHTFLVPALLTLNPIPLLISCLSDSDYKTSSQAIRALTNFASTPEGLERTIKLVGAVDTRAGTAYPNSSDPRIREWAKIVCTPVHSTYQASSL
ncbi:armadillo-type protein [Mycena amicta]|nr:armadillo-type protein [Mycena amicta]